MNNKLTFFLVVVAFSLLSIAQRPFDLYKPIIDKCPFGPPPSDPTVLPEKSSRGYDRGELDAETAKEVQQLEKAVSVSAIVQKPAGSIMVGFSDASDTGGPKHYYLAVGERKDGWVVKDVDMLTKRVTLEKDEVQIERTLGEKAATASNASQPSALGHAPASLRPSILSNNKTSARPLLLGGPGGTMKSRRQRRLDEEAAAMARENERKASEEAAAQQRSKDEAERAELRQHLMDLQDEIKKRREERGNSADSKNDARVEPNQDASN